MCAAAKGNKYNEIWTLEKTESFFDSVLEYVLDNKKCRSLSEALCELGEYDDLINYLEEKHNKSFDQIKRAKTIVKTRLVNQGLDGDANPTMAIFILKNNHGMSDRIQQEHSGEIKGSQQSIPLVLQDGRTYEDLKNELKPE